MRPLCTAIAALALFALAGCADDEEEVKNPCELDSAHLNPMDPMVVEADAALARLKAFAGPGVLDSKDLDALPDIACKKNMKAYSDRIHAMVAPFWWAYWGSSCEDDRPPEVKGVRPAVANVAFDRRCPSGIGPNER